jgi:hypothetical protein
MSPPPDEDNDDDDDVLLGGEFRAVIKIYRDMEGGTSARTLPYVDRRS